MRTNNVLTKLAWDVCSLMSGFRANAPFIFVTVLLVAGAGGLVSVAVAQQKRWAAVDATADVASPVTWGSTELQARERAIEACKKVAKTCAGNPATTVRLDDVFAHMCCTKPRHGCAAVAAQSRSEARNRIEALFAAAGYSNCSVRHYMSAADGAQLDEGEAAPKEKTKRGRRTRDR